MKVGYFCYRLSGTGPRTRAADVINGVATNSEWDVVVLTAEPEKITSDADIQPVSLANPIQLLRETRRAFADVDLIHVPINVYQVLFVRLLYHGPLVGGVGPGLQRSRLHRRLGRLLGIDVKIKNRDYDIIWEQSGYDTEVVIATIDREHFYPYSEERTQALREKRGIGDDETVVLYVGTLSEGQGAHIVDGLARLTRENDTIRVIVAGAGPMAETFRDRNDLTFEGYVDNKTTPDLYNLADVTVAPRKNDVTSNVGLESIACGTPMITTAEGDIERLFSDCETYVWADRTPEAVLETVRELTANPEYYEAQRQRGFETLDEMELTLDTAIETVIGVYEGLVTAD